jgi:RNA polymerase sigma-B factor
MLNVFKAYKRNPSSALRNRLVEMNIGLARSIAHQLSKNTTEPYEDLEQVASLGLMAAVERFDPDKGLRFSTYAIPTIKGKVLQYLRDKGATIRIPQNLQDLYIKKAKTEDALYSSLGRKPQEKELIAALNVTSDRYHQTLLAKQNRSPVSLSTPVNEDASVTLEDTLLCCDTQVLYEVEELSDELLQGLDLLLQEVFLANTTCKTTAQRLGVSTNTMKRQLRKAVEEFAAAC